MLTVIPLALFATLAPNMNALCTVLPMMDDRIVRPAYARIPIRPLCLEESCPMVSAPNRVTMVMNGPAT